MPPATDPIPGPGQGGTGGRRLVGPRVPPPVIRRLLKAVSPRTRRSGGVRVTASAHRLIRRGNAARDAGRWRDAIAAYSAALVEDAGLHHIRVQLGHMLKQIGSFEDADLAYAEAARLAAHDAEPLIQRAHLAKHRHDPGTAVALLLAAVRRRDRADQAEHELRLLLDAGPTLPSAFLRSPDRDERPVPPAAPSGRGRRPPVFDLTDLVGHFRYQRAPTGIQRVQIEGLATMLAGADADVPVLGCFVSGRGGMLPIPLDLFREVAALAGASSDVADQAWQEARARLFIELALSDDLAMPPRAILINLGMSLWVADYFLFIRNAKERQGISYVPFVHDLIPVVTPDYCVDGVKKEFAAWLAGLFQHADGFLVNSTSTARDLVSTARLLGHEVAPDRVEVVPLDGDFRWNGAPLAADALDKWGLRGVDYALLVSTIEPRKNHLLAFQAWSELIRRHGPAAVPRLVCVGRDGWRNDHVFARLAADTALIPRVTVIHSVSDAELALLYRESRFTVYPSHYEGWGLPVTEALCHGRLPVVADNSSLPEAGAGYALLFGAGSVAAMADAVARAAFDPAWRRGQEARIADGYRPRSWAAIARQVTNAARRMAADRGTAPVAVLGRGAYRSVTRHHMPEIWPGLTGGEMFRIGDGWLWPEPDGCRIGSDGATLRMRLADAEAGATGLRLHVRLRGLAEADCPVTVGIGTRDMEAVVPAGETMWVGVDVGDGPSPSVRIKGTVSEPVATALGGVGGVRAASVAVTGLLLTDRADPEARRTMASIDGWRSGPRVLG